MKQDWIDGWVTRLQSGFYTVETGVGVFVCHLRGRLKRVRVQGDFLAIGDHVKISRQPDGSGMIEDITERVHALTRSAPTPKGDYMQVLLANPDQVVLVFACANPAPHLRMLDRFLVICEKQGIPVSIVANKVDLVGQSAAEAIFGIYPGLGYPVLYTSVKTGQGVADLAAHLEGKLSGLAGPSGVGKSSLLNAIQPDLGLAVREVSSYTEKGRHTTVVRQMFHLNRPAGGYVADLPGLRSLALWDTEPEELDGYFPELRDLVSMCQFNDCTHTHEPGCAVRAAVESGQVALPRYESYIKLRYGDEG